LLEHPKLTLRIPVQFDSGQWLRRGVVLRVRNIRHVIRNITETALTRQDTVGSVGRHVGVEGRDSTELPIHLIHVNDRGDVKREVWVGHEVLDGIEERSNHTIHGSSDVGFAIGYTDSNTLGQESTHLHEHSRRRLDAEDPLEVLLGSLAEARERVLHRVETALEALDDAVKYRLTNVLEHPREGYDKGRNRVSEEENNRLNQGDDKLREDLGRLGDDTDEHIDDSSDDLDKDSRGRLDQFDDTEQHALDQVHDHTRDLHDKVLDAREELSSRPDQEIR